jgi:hypothetical protein
LASTTGLLLVCVIKATQSAKMKYIQHSLSLLGNCFAERHLGLAGYCGALVLTSHDLHHQRWTRCLGDENVHDWRKMNRVDENILPGRFPDGARPCLIQSFPCSHRRYARGMWDPKAWATALTKKAKINAWRGAEECVRVWMRSQLHRHAPANQSVNSQWQVYLFLEARNGFCEDFEILGQLGLHRNRQHGVGNVHWLHDSLVY